ncbi:MAG: hypothetical protein LW860_01990 [Xanthomonadaceae bacterium]|jgi:hypothetical protein|nr:hypothetical protein [Xanthomonadaceae bacterium]
MRDPRRSSDPTAEPSGDFEALAGALDRLLADFDRAYDRRPLAATLLLTDFFLPYLREMYRIFDGDIALAIVLAEIGDASTRRFTDPRRHDALDLVDANSETLMAAVRPCNALSASLASGVPRETARRKVLELAARGWIAEHEGGWVTTPAAGERFVPHFNREQARRLLQSARRLIDVLDRD